MLNIVQQNEWHAFQHYKQFVRETSFDYIIYISVHIKCVCCVHDAFNKFYSDELVLYNLWAEFCSLTLRFWILLTIYVFKDILSGVVCLYFWRMCGHKVLVNWFVAYLWCVIDEAHIVRFLLYAALIFWCYGLGKVLLKYIL